MTSHAFVDDQPLDHVRAERAKAREAILAWVSGRPSAERAYDLIKAVASAPDLDERIVERTLWSLVHTGELSLGQGIRVSARAD